MPANAGLCATCRYAQTVESARGAVFLLCAAHKDYEHLQKYPRLPMLACDVYKKNAEEEPSGDSGN
jgi:hypothetical protein